MEQYLSVEQAAAIKGLTASGLRYLIRRGRLKATRLGRRAYAILRTDLDNITYGKDGRPRRNPLTS